MMRCPGLLVDMCSVRQGLPKIGLHSMHVCEHTGSVPWPCRREVFAGSSVQRCGHDTPQCSSCEGGSTLASCGVRHECH